MRSPFDNWSCCSWLRNIIVIYNYVGLRLDDWECLTLTHLVRIVVNVEINMVTRILMMGIYPEVLTSSLMEVRRGAVVPFGWFLKMGEIAS